MKSKQRYNVFHLLVHSFSDTLIDGTLAAPVMHSHRHRTSAKTMQLIEHPCGVGQVISDAPIDTKTHITVIGIANDADRNAD